MEKKGSIDFTSFYFGRDLEGGAGGSGVGVNWRSKHSI